MNERPSEALGRLMKDVTRLQMLARDADKGDVEADQAFQQEETALVLKIQAFREQLERLDEGNEDVP